MAGMALVKLFTNDLPDPPHLRTFRSNTYGR